MIPRLSLSVRILFALAITLMVAIVAFFASYGTLSTAFGRWMLEVPGRSELEFWSYLWLPLFVLFGVVFVIALMTLNVIIGDSLDRLLDEPSLAVPAPREDESGIDNLRYAPPRWGINRNDLPDARQMPPPPPRNSYAPNVDRRQLPVAPPSRTRVIRTDIVSPDAAKEPAYLRKREHFDSEFAFAEYVAQLITATGKYLAQPRGDIIHLTRNDRLVGVCKVLLLDRSEYVPVQVIERFAQQRIPDTSVLMLATTGRYERPTRQNAKRLEVRLLDGNDLRQIEAVLKRRAQQAV